MLDLNNLRKEKYEDLCKILNWVLVALYAVFFILSLFPYFSVEAGGEVVATVGGVDYSTTVKEADSWSLLGYVGFPYAHESVGEWQEDMYKENKSTVKSNEENGYKGFVWGTLGKLGVNRTVTDKKGNQTSEPYEDLDVPGITTKTVSVKQVGAILFLDIFALVNLVLLILKKGSTQKAICNVLWGIIGVLCFRGNYLLNMGTTAVKSIMFVLVIAALVVSVVATVFFIIDGRSRAAYLKSVSAAYA